MRPVDGDVIAVLPRDTEVTVLSRQSWLRVRAGDREGYVSGDFIEASGAAADSGAGRPANIRPFSSSQMIGEPMRVDEGFEPALERINGYARQRGVEIWVTSSFREPGQVLAGAVVEPARASNHLVGHAIDMNVRLQGELFNSRRLRRASHPELPAAVRGFLDDVRADGGLRWGGDFTREDPVHIDDKLNIDEPDLWMRKFRDIREFRQAPPGASSALLADDPATNQMRGPMGTTNATRQQIEEKATRPDLQVYVYIGDEPDLGWTRALSLESSVPKMEVFQVPDSGAIADWVGGAPAPKGILFGWAATPYRVVDARVAEDRFALLEAVGEAQAATEGA
jgi:hypothetical protein